MEVESLKASVTRLLLKMSDEMLLSGATLDDLVAAREHVDMASELLQRRR
jgi:hypothetical protein